MYTNSGIVSSESPIGDQLFFSWRSRGETETEKKAVAHLHLHIYPELGRELALVLDEEAWNIDMNRLKPS